MSAWPTLVAIDPAGYVVGSHAGEFTSEMLVSFIDGLVAKARSNGTLDEKAVELELDSPTIEPGRLRYPGKIVISEGRVAIADSGNHRVLLGHVDDEGSVIHIDRSVGTGSPGFKDGLDSSFRSPQGMAFSPRDLYVADSENHAIRSIDLTTGQVSTLAGTGHQLRTRADQQAGSMSSPWDITLSEGTLYVAMAGIHQIWGVDIVTGKSRVHAGTGGEDIRDGELHSALLAQPMGITIDKGRLYFADSESSAIRWASTGEGGEVGTIAGTGLFDFGDVDGIGDEAKLQHVQGVAVHPDGRLLVADSYNDSLKLIDLRTREVKTWVRGFHEPGGVCCGAKHAYVADTNAHRIASVHLETGEVKEVRIE